MGVYRDDLIRPWVLPSVREAEKRIIAQELGMEYPPITDLSGFLSSVFSLAYGASSPALLDKRVGGTPTVGGTGAISVAYEFLKRFMPEKTLMVSTPSWMNHTNIALRTGIPIQPYRYVNLHTKMLDTEGMCADLAKGNAE